MADKRKSLKGEFRIMPNSEPVHPPVLIVKVKSKREFDRIEGILNRELFIRVRNPEPRYKRLILNTVGDAKILANSVRDYSHCELDLAIDLKDHGDEVRMRNDNSPLWALLFVHGDDLMLSAIIDKITEQVRELKYV
jgi:hypothetical protein